MSSSNGKIEPVKKLKAIYLAYEDGTVISVPEDKKLRIGTAFMQVVGKEKFEWIVVAEKKPGLLTRIKTFFDI